MRRVGFWVALLLALGLGEGEVLVLVDRDDGAGHKRRLGAMLTVVVADGALA